MWAALSCRWGPGWHKEEHEPRTGIRLALLPDHRLGVTSSLLPRDFPPWQIDRTRVIPSFLSGFVQYFVTASREVSRTGQSLETVCVNLTQRS